MAQPTNKPNTNSETTQLTYAEELKALMMKYQVETPEARKGRLMETLGLAEQLFGASYSITAVPVVSQRSKGKKTLIEIDTEIDIDVVVNPSWQRSVIDKNSPD